MKRVLIYQVRNGSRSVIDSMEFDTIQDLKKAVADMEAGADRDGSVFTYINYWSR